MNKVFSSFFRQVIVVLLGFSEIASALAEAPVHYDVARYETIWKISPFVAVTDLSGKVDDLSGRYILTGFARMGDKDVAFVFDRTTLERFPLTQGTPRSGLVLESLQHEGDLQSLRAKVSTGGRILELGYDASVTATPNKPGAQPAAQPTRSQQAMHPQTPATNPQKPAATPPPAATPSRNKMVGAAPTPPPEAPPAPRRVIRRRGIVAPQ